MARGGTMRSGGGSVVAKSALRSRLVSSVRLGASRGRGGGSRAAVAASHDGQRQACLPKAAGRLLAINGVERAPMRLATWIA